MSYLTRVLMTTAEATERHQCEYCREHGDGACGWDCVESETASIRCPKCHERLWQTGSLSDLPHYSVCPVCSTEIPTMKYHRKEAVFRLAKLV